MPIVQLSSDGFVAYPEAVDLALGFSKKLENLEAAVAGFMAYYNFCWRTRYPDNSGKAGKRRPPAAMLAGVTDRLWTFDDLFVEAMKYAPPIGTN